MKRTLWTLPVLALAAACSSSGDAQPAADGTEGAAATADAAATTAQVACAPSSRMPVEGRASPYDSVRFTLGGSAAQVCYGRPYAKGRTVFGEGGLYPWGTFWRTGANEPTTIHLTSPASIAGVAVEPGSYSLYTIPGETEWTVVVNRSTSQWGHENQYTAEVEAQEVGRGTVPSGTIEEPVEQFTIRTEPAEGDATHLVLEWQRTRVQIPIAAR